MSPIVEKYSK